MGGKTCVFLNDGCLFGGTEICTEEVVEGCGEAEKRKELTKTPCPLMEGKGYPRETSKCDIPQLRAFVPSGAECHNGRNCRIREIMPKIAGKVAGNNRTDGTSKIPNDDLKKAGIEIITTMKAKPTTEKVTI